MPILREEISKGYDDYDSPKEARDNSLIEESILSLENEIQYLQKTLHVLFEKLKPYESTNKIIPSNNEKEDTKPESPKSPMRRKITDIENDLRETRCLTEGIINALEI